MGACSGWDFILCPPQPLCSQVPAAAPLPPGSDPRGLGSPFLSREQHQSCGYIPPTPPTTQGLSREENGNFPKARQGGIGSWNGSVISAASPSSSETSSEEITKPWQSRAPAAPPSPGRKPELHFGFLRAWRGGRRRVCTQRGSCGSCEPPKLSPAPPRAQFRPPGAPLLPAEAEGVTPVLLPASLGTAVLTPQGWWGCPMSQPGPEGTPPVPGQRRAALTLLSLAPGRAGSC